MSIADDIPWLENVPPPEMRRIVDALYRVHRLISLITDLDTLLESIMQEGKQVARAEASSLMLYDPKSGELFFQVAQGETGDQQALKREVRLKLGQGIAGTAGASREPVNVPDVSQDRRFYAGADTISRFETRSILAVPLVDRDTLVGVIEVINKTGGGAFTATDLHVMQMFSSLAATSITNARLIEESLRAERMGAIGQAVAGLTHHIKNLLSGMSGGVELIDQGIESGDLELVRRAWPIFKRSAGRVSEFVQDMLAFSKPRRPVREPCSIGSLVDDSIRSFMGLRAQDRVKIDAQVDVEGTFPLDPNGIFRCLLNLLTNACDAAPRLGGHVAVTARLNDAGSLVIDVTDNGPGIPEEAARRVFEPFYSTKGSHGTGLGLAVTQKIVEEHGGCIELERGPEGGALFRMIIPRVGKPKKEEHSGEEGVLHV